MEGLVDRRKNTFKTTYWLMMQKMLWITIPFLIYYFNYLTFYRPPLVGWFFFWFRFQFSVSWWKLFIIIISKIQNLLAVFIKFIYHVQPLENDKEGALVRVPKCSMQNYLPIRVIKSSFEWIAYIYGFFKYKKVSLTYAMTGGWDLLVGWLLYLCPYNPACRQMATYY